MKKIINVLALLIVFGITIKESYSQVGVSYYSSNILSLNTSTNYRVGAEFRIFAGKSIEYLPIEVDVFYNFKSKDYHRFSVGTGLRLEVMSGENAAFTVPLQLEVYPIQEFKNISFLFELAPEVYIEDDVKIRGLLGLRYTFNK